MLILQSVVKVLVQMNYIMFLVQLDHRVHLVNLEHLEVQDKRVTEVILDYLEIPEHQENLDKPVTKVTKAEKGILENRVQLESLENLVKLVLRVLMEIVETVVVREHKGQKENRDKEDWLVIKEKPAELVQLVTMVMLELTDIMARMENLDSLVRRVFKE